MGWPAVTRASKPVLYVFEEASVVSDRESKSRWRSEFSSRKGALKAVPVYSQPVQGHHSYGVESAARRESLWPLTAMGVFLFFGASMALLAGTTLTWQGTFLDHIWVLNAPAYRQLAPFGKTVGVPFLLLSMALAVAGVGWFGRRLWGWRLAVVIIATQVLGDLISICIGHFVRGAVGVTIASALLFYLSRQAVRDAFVARRATGR